MIIKEGIKKAIPSDLFDNLDVYNYSAQIQLKISSVSIEQMYFNLFSEIGALHGKRTMQGVEKDTKADVLSSFVLFFRSSLKNWIDSNLGLRIVGVRQSLIEYLINEVKKGIDNELTIRQISTNIRKLVNSKGFYNWQALRIARTETTAAANYGASIAVDYSDYVLEKEWISSNDPRTRQIEKGDKYDHIDMEGVKVSEKEVFNVQGNFLRFPGDPKGDAANVINCRCTLSLVPKRDENGRLVLKL